MEPYLSYGLAIFNIVFALGIFFYAKRELEKQADSKLTQGIGKAKDEILPWIIDDGLPQLREYMSSNEGQILLEELMEPVVVGLQKRIYGAIGGIASGETRGMKALEKAAAEDLISGAHPLASTILDKLPSVKKLLQDNPGLLALLPQVAQKYQGFIGQVMPQGNGNVPEQIRGL